MKINWTLFAILTVHTVAMAALFVGALLLALAVL